MMKTNPCFPPVVMEEFHSFGKCSCTVPPPPPHLNLSLLVSWQFIDRLLVLFLSIAVGYTFCILCMYRWNPHMKHLLSTHRGKNITIQRGEHFPQQFTMWFLGYVDKKSLGDWWIIESNVTHWCGSNTPVCCLDSSFFVHSLLGKPHSWCPSVLPLLLRTLPLARFTESVI